jgi:gas vesicle protein
MANTPESSFGRAKKFTIFAFGTIRFYLFEITVVTPIAVFVLLWQPSWAKEGSALIYYQVLLPVAGAILGLIIVFLIGFFLAPYHERNELRAKVEQYEQERNNPKSKYYDQIAKETTNKHWENLAILAQELASKMELPFSIDQRYLNLKFDKNDDGIHALMFIDYCNSFDYEISDDYVKSDADWGLYSYLQTHLLAEDNSWMENMSKLRDNVEILHNKLHDVSLTATNITTEWSVIIHGDWNEDYSVEAGDLSSKVREAIEPMQKDVISACNKCYEVIKPMRITLGHLVKRKTFKGECPACP